MGVCLKFSCLSTIFFVLPLSRKFRIRSLANKRAQKFAGDVALEGRPHDVEGRGLSGPHAEAGVMLGGKDDALDAGDLGGGGPVTGLEFARVEGARQVVDEAFEVVAGSADHGVGDGGADLRIEAPVDEEAEAEVAEPFEPLELVLLAGEGEREGGAEEERTAHAIHCRRGVRTGSARIST